MRCRYNAVNVLQNPHKKYSIPRPWVYYLTYVLKAIISWQFWPRYNGTGLKFEGKTSVTCQIHEGHTYLALTGLQCASFVIYLDKKGPRDIKNAPVRPYSVEINLIGFGVPRMRWSHIPYRIVQDGQSITYWPIWIYNYLFVFYFILPNGSVASFRIKQDQCANPTEISYIPKWAEISPGHYTHFNWSTIADVGAFRYNVHDGSTFCQHNVGFDHDVDVSTTTWFITIWMYNYRMY